MGRTDISDWEPVFDDLVLELEETTPPEDRSGDWYQGLAEFSRHSFVRLLLSVVDGELRIVVEIALGPGDGVQRPGPMLKERWSDLTATDWQLETDDVPWMLETTLAGDAPESPDRLRELLLDILELSEDFETVDETDDWIEILSGDDESSPATSRDSDASDDPDDNDSKTSSELDGPFESIGDGSSTEESPADDREATVEATAATRAGDRVLVAVGFPQVLASRQLDALGEGLDHHLHTKFEVETRPADADDLDLSMPPEARTVLAVEVDPDGFIGSVDELLEDLDRFLDRLEKFSSYGVDLFEYLGVGETVFDDDDTTETTDDSDESRLDFRKRTPRKSSRKPSNKRAAGSPGRDPEVDAPDEDGVVLELESPPESGSSRGLKANDYTDPRLQRPDAETALVDVVLRHPGYSDSRIGQVLSILLSVEYHNAIDLADDAPCVIAWGVSQSRARRFKDVIESAGGKVVLVEPGTFGEG